jgi:hypothetical protein
MQASSRSCQTSAVTDRVWVTIEAAVRAGLEDKSVIVNPPRSDQDVEWLSATIADHVCAALPKEVHRAFRAWLDSGEDHSSSEEAKG